ncbi:iron complex transport system permease protein [Deinobacterium chartae]|uniref:Iron complex transport system permease protein n=1 Tax=Deinobacterium chartae TaxID=521158 RepID=A0A841I018_9DEIO|nr:iron ABC transporter permease [Deinobacterium chartae]MBB6097472.1 iron complex transport system permease protein [Deinobacterium chartae]
MTRARPLPSSARPLTVGVAALAAAALLALGLGLSISVGAASIPLEQVWRLMLRPDDSSNSLIVWTLRLPRALVAALAGAALGVSGALMQGVTRNPLASPGILGVNAGAALAILVMVVFLPGLPAALYVPIAFLGGAGAALLVYAVASGVGLTPLRLALAGVAVGALISAASNALMILFEQRAQGALFSLSGSVAGRTWEHVYLLAPWVGVTLAVSLLLARRVNLLALGEDVARGLGARTERDRLIVSLIAVLLAAAAVAVTGPIGFVGLMVPHVARALLGPDYRAVLPLSALLGAALLTYADVAARLIDKPLETPVGILISAIGAPFFVYLARRIHRADS